ncbi:hypothetical protein GCM10010266_45780 [Streptomyces griseomycini]|nr:hypothetical protein GCM10010266_45780 [Streptomyces griseomycini]
MLQGGADRRARRGKAREIRRGTERGAARREVAAAPDVASGEARELPRARADGRGRARFRGAGRRGRVRFRSRR